MPGPRSRASAGASGGRLSFVPFRAIGLIDLLIAVAVLVGLANGYRRGFWLSLLQYVGLMLGVVAGAALAPVVLNGLAMTGMVRQMAAVLFLVVCGSLGSTFGYWIGEPVRTTFLRHGFLRPPEQVAGALFSAATVLSVAWFLGLTFSQGPSPDLARQIQRSSILRVMDSIFPAPPAFLGGVQRILAAAPFPQPFAGLPPNLPEPLSPPASVDTPSVTAAAQAVYRVEGRGCGGLVSGSAYPVARGYLVTNAHVVSGTSRLQVSQGQARRSPVPATVVLFDAVKDVAILHVPQLSVEALPETAASRGTQAAVIGYPGGGAERVSPAVVAAVTHAQGRDIYGDGLYTREIWILDAHVEPGNSGGPVIDLHGGVLGLVFAASSTNSNQAYALTNDEIRPDVEQAQSQPRTVDTSRLPCAV